MCEANGTHIDRSKARQAGRQADRQTDRQAGSKTDKPERT